MKYASIDIETTGLNAETCQTLSIGVVLEDTDLQLPFDEIPKLHIIIPHKEIYGEPYALNLNKDLIARIGKYNNRHAGIFLPEDRYTIYLEPEFIVEHLEKFFLRNGFEGKVIVAGKNYTGFDLKFLSKLPRWNTLTIHRRVIDPAPLFMDWHNDKELPDLSLCKSRAGIAGDVTHNAVEDAFDVIQVLRTKYN